MVSLLPFQCLHVKSSLVTGAQWFLDFLFSASAPIPSSVMTSVASPPPPPQPIPTFASGSAFEVVGVRSMAPPMPYRPPTQFVSPGPVVAPPPTTCFIPSGGEYMSPPPTGGFVPSHGVVSATPTKVSVAYILWCYLTLFGVWFLVFAKADASSI